MSLIFSAFMITVGVGLGLVSLILLIAAAQFGLLILVEFLEQRRTR